MCERPEGYGLTAEIKAKMEAKYDIELEQQVRVWMESVTGQPLVPGYNKFIMTYWKHLIQILSLQSLFVIIFRRNS